ncbi:UNVERIFIED_CONTAM: hypothetical protein RMT77_001563 [Armadillidium vulgare]
MSLTSYGISPLVLSNLKKAGFLLDSDVSHLKPSELASAAKLSLKESAEVIRLTAPKTESILSQSQTLKFMLENETDEADHIITFSEDLDNLLGGGFPLKSVMEISGTPGIGKTQMCLQACVSVQLPSFIGGVEGEAVYVDTEGSFSILRLKEMADWAERHTHQVYDGSKISNFNTKEILNGIYYFRCHNHFELLAVIKHMYSFLKNHSKVKLIVIDSIAFHFRHDFTDMSARSSLLCSMSQDLIHLASKHNLTVIVTNQMTTKVRAIGHSEIVPALGETWGHCPTIRLLLHWKGLSRIARVIKSPHIPLCTVEYQITAGGIRNKKFKVDPGCERKRKRSGE